LTYPGLTIITSRSNLDLLAYCIVGEFRKTSIFKRTGTINNFYNSRLWQVLAHSLNAQLSEYSHYSLLPPILIYYISLHPKQILKVSFLDKYTSVLNPKESTAEHWERDLKRQQYRQLKLYNSHAQSLQNSEKMR